MYVAMQRTANGPHMEMAGLRMLAVCLYPRCCVAEDAVNLQQKKSCLGFQGWASGVHGVQLCVRAVWLQSSPVQCQDMVRSTSDVSGATGN